MLAELDENPYPLLRRLREADPVCWAPELSAWLVTRYDLAVEVLKNSGSFTVDHPRFTTARVTGPSMLSLDGPAHARQRNAFTRGLRPEALRRDFIRAEVSRLIEGIRPFGHAELRRDLAGPLAAAVMGDLLGLNQPAGTILGWYDEIVRVVASLAGSTEAGAYRTPSFGILAENVALAVSGGKSALLAGAAQALGMGEIVSNAAVLLFGGIETTEGMISNAISHTLAYGTLAVEESLRLEPAAAMVDRYATRDVALGGARVRQGDQVTVSITGANRDPAAFTDPDLYDPSRANAGRHLAFAHGPHFCVGAHLARLETELAVAAIIKLPGLRLSGPAVPRGVVFRKPPELNATWRVSLPAAPQPGTGPLRTATCAPLGYDAVVTTRLALDEPHVLRSDTIGHAWLAVAGRTATPRGCSTTSTPAVTRSRG
jgi:cytochrome P450